MPISPESPVHAVERREIDGIPAWISPRSTRYCGALLFRVGTVDERFPQLGQSHIIEHLALFGLGPHLPFEYNGFVSGLMTGFYATGRPDEVAGFLNSVAAGLNDLPMSRLRDETRVLRTEAASRIPGFVEEALWLRHGCVGHGLRGLPELALYAPDAESIRAWAAERFTAGNAVLWFSGPPPEGVHLQLPPGPRIPCPDPAPIDDLLLPAYCVQSKPLIGIAFEHPREDWLGIPLQIVQSRVMNELRYSRGLAYDVAMAYEPIAAATVHAAIMINCLTDHASVVRDVLLSTVSDVARDGPTPEELERIHETYCRGYSDPDAGVQEVSSAAHNELLGYPVRRATELLDELSRMTPADIAQKMAAAMPSMMLVLPSHTPPPAGFAPYPTSSEQLSGGRTFRTVRQRFPWSRGPRLVIGPEGVSVQMGGDLAAVRYDSCAAATVQSNGRVRLWDLNGSQVLLDSNDWRGADRAIQEVVERVPADRLVHMLDDPPSPPAAAAPPPP